MRKKRTGGENIKRGKGHERAGRKGETRPPSTRRTRQDKRKGTRGEEEGGKVQERQSIAKGMGGRIAGKRTSSKRTEKNRSICNISRHKPHAKRRLGRLTRQRRPTEMEMWKAGRVFYPWNDWGIEGRQANDRASAEENAANRQRREWAAQGRNYQGDYPEQAIMINTTRRWS